MKIVAAILLFILPTIFVKAQNRELERLIESLPPEAQSSELIDIIDYYSANKINLLEAEPLDLQELPGFDEPISKKILRYAKKNPELSATDVADSLNLNEFRAFLLETCAEIAPPSFASEPLSTRYRARNIHRFERTKGSKEGKFAGSDLDFYQRIQASKGAFSAGLLTNKDLGERSLTSFASAYASYKGKRFQFVAGDYSTEFGLGSLLWKGFGMGKGVDAISPATSSAFGARPYRSSMETRFFRGAAISASIKTGRSNLNLAAWASSVSRAATFDSAAGAVSSLYSSGYFRTESEIAKRGAVREISSGAMALWSAENFSVGAAALYLDYDKRIQSESSSAFFGESGVLSSAFASAEFGAFFQAAEISFDSRSNLAARYSASVSGDICDVAAMARYFAADFRSPFGFNSGEFSSPANELGFYIGLYWKSLENIKISTYFDVFRSIERTYYIPAAARGMEIFGETTAKIDSKTSARFRYKYESKTDFINSEKWGGKTLADRTRQNLRFEAKRKFPLNGKLRFRFEGANVDYGSLSAEKWGALGFIEYSASPAEWFGVGSRYTLFSTDGYDSAIWQYEYSAPGYMRSVALFDEGARLLVFAKIEPADWLDFRLRFALTEKNDASSLGSGYLQIDGGSDNRFMAQIDLSL